MTYYLVRVDTNEIFEERTEKPTEVQVLSFKSLYHTDIIVIKGSPIIQNWKPGSRRNTSGTGNHPGASHAEGPLTKVVGHDKTWKGQEPHKKLADRVVLKSGELIKVNAQSAYSCKDDPITPEILATGNKPYFVVAAGQPGAVWFCRKD